MANENAQLAEFAENLWKNYIKPKYQDASKDTVSFYRAKVVSNDGNNRLTIQRPYDNSYQVSCTDGMSSATVGMQVIVVRLGNGANNQNHLVIAQGNGSPIDSGGGGGHADNGLPAGGTTGQALVKNSSTNYDASWQTINASITVDSALSDSSENPVQNKVITNALNGKAGTSVATTSANGLMSSTDKSKLNDIQSGAEVNQHAFSSITPYTIPSGEASQWADTTGSLVASTKTDDVLLIAGSNITITKRYNSSEDITGLQISATGGGGGGTGTVNSYTAQNPNLTSTNGVCTWTVTHNLNTSFPVVSVYSEDGAIQVMADVQVANLNTVYVKILSDSNILSYMYRVVVMGTSQS